MSTTFLPLAVLAAVPIAVLLQRALRRCLPLAFASTLIGFIVAGVLFASRLSSPVQLLPLLIIDPMGCLYGMLITAAAAATAIMSYTYVKGLFRSDEYFLFLSLAALGAAIIIFARHFASFFLGLEMMSVSFYALIAFKQRRPWG